MSKYVIANWKSYKKLFEAEAWLAAFEKSYQPHPEVKAVLAPPAVYLSSLHRLIKERRISLSLAIQDVSPFPLGAYTGEVAAEMVADMVDMAIVGHSERRRYFHESHQEIANKAGEALAAGISPLLCVDKPYVREQLNVFEEEEINAMIIGYGPVEAIGINVAQPLEQAADGIREIRRLAPESPILYGGSVNADNAGSYLNLGDVSGLMVGSASLDPEEFAEICRIVSLQSG